jgi:group I intron endonuclease
MTTNLLNGKIYIGQHQNKKFNPKYLGSGKIFTKAIKKNGKENFIVEILHKCDTFSMLDQKEIYYIKKYDSTNPDIGYNVSYGGEACMRGLHHTNKTKIILSKAHKGIPLSEEHKNKISNSNKGKIKTKRCRKLLSIANTGKVRTLEQRKHLSEITKGRKHTEEWKLNISKRMKGRKVSKATRKKISESNMGKKFSEETKMKMSKSQTGKKLSIETKNKIGKYQRNKIVSEESRKRMSIAQQNKTEETKHKLSESNKGKHHKGEPRTNYIVEHNEETKNKIRKANLLHYYSPEIVDEIMSHKSKYWRPKNKKDLLLK